MIFSPVTANVPSVIVPVLSIATADTLDSDSSCTPPLINIPLRAPCANPHTYVNGVEMTSAHGHATTHKINASYKYFIPISLPQNHGILPSKIALAYITGV